MSKLSRRCVLLFRLSAILLLALVSLFVVLSLYVHYKLPNVDKLKELHLQAPMQVYTQDGVLIGEFGEKKRTPVHLAAVPLFLRQAILDTEDQRFYQHSGVDLRGLLRALKQLLITHRKHEGASTITMQVARNFFLSRKKTYLRKFNEMLLALLIEHKLSKDKILELYLNKIYLGHRAYGVAAAAQVYYGKSLSALTPAEMAMIAGLAQSPSAHNPLTNPEAALKRRNHVLDRMKMHEHITNTQYETAQQAPITASFHSTPLEGHAPYLAETIRKIMVSMYGPSAYTEGLKVFATAPYTLQNTAQKTLQAHLERYRHKQAADTPPAEGALVAMNPANGAILALVGGFDFETSHFNRATQGKLQPGSAFKPFVYSAALARGFSLASIINDAPVVMPQTQTKQWRPQNDNRKFYGPTRLRVGLTHSRNLVSIRLLQALGLPQTLTYLSRFGFDPDTLPHNLTLSLGTANLTPLELTRAYAVFANGGAMITPHFIDHIDTQTGEHLFQADAEYSCVAAFTGKPLPDSTTRCAQETITPQNAYLMTSALQDVIQTGTARRARSLKRSDLGGKTGTTNDQRDAWFIGYNSDLVTTVWMGFDHPHTLGKYGSQLALPVWIDFMKQALAGKPEHALEEPEGLVHVRIDAHTGQRMTDNTHHSLFELFRDQNLAHALPKTAAETTVSSDMM